MKELIFLFAFFTLVGGYFLFRGRGMTIRKWIFISILTLLFILVGVFGAELMADKVLTKPPAGAPSWAEYRTNVDNVKGVVLLSMGIIGLVLMTLLRKQRMQEIGFSYGIGGAIQIIAGSIILLSHGAAYVKFAASVTGVIIVSYLMYRYREFLMENEHSVG